MKQQQINGEFLGKTVVVTGSGRNRKRYCSKICKRKSKCCVNFK